MRVAVSVQQRHGCLHWQTVDTPTRRIDPSAMSLPCADWEGAPRTSDRAHYSLTLTSPLAYCTSLENEEQHIHVVIGTSPLWSDSNTSVTYPLNAEHDAHRVGDNDSRYCYTDHDTSNPHNTSDAARRSASDELRWSRHMCVGPHCRTLELSTALTIVPVSCQTGTCYTGLDGFIGCCSVSVIPRSSPSRGSESSCGC